MTVVCAGISFATEGAPIPSGASLWTALLITGVLASGVAFAIQTYAQRHLSPTRTALILTSEPAFGGLFGWWLAGDILGTPELVGAALILAGMLMAEGLSFARPRGGGAVPLEPSLEGPPVPDLAAGTGDAEA